MGTFPKNLFVALSFILLSLFTRGQQHINTIDATINDETKEISIKQKFTYFNSSNSTLDELYFNDWNHAYSGKNTSLAKRFGDYFRKSLHLAKKKERGFTKNISLVGKEYEAIPWERHKYKDIIKVHLEKPLAPGDSIEMFWTYIVKLPSSKFTDYGFGYENGYYLKDWYLTPAVYDGKWHLYPNKDLNDQYAAVANSRINLIFPDSLFLASNFDASPVSKFPKGQQVILEEDDRQNCTIFLTNEKRFVRHQTPSFNILTDIKGERYSEMAQGFSIVRVTDFITANLGEFPHDHLLVSEADYNRNPLYGINQLPRFIRPYSQQFQFELKFLKTALYSFVKETLYLNIRKEQWIHDAIVNYLLIKYVDQFYPDKKLTGQLSKLWGFRGYNLAKMDFNDQYYYLQMASVRRNDHQALATANDSLSRFNQKIANRYKAGLGLAYLAEFIGYDKLDESLREFYAENKSRSKLTAEALKEKLRSKTKLDILWFFDEYVALRNNIDFKITKVSKRKDSIYFSIKNRTGSNVPISVFGLQKDSVITKYWYTNIDSIRAYRIPNNGETRLVLNYDQKIPESNQRNNWKSVNGFLSSNKKLQLRFLQDVENPFFNQVFYVPEFKFNVNDGISAGISLKNKPLLIRKPFVYQIKPRYSSKEQALIGSASFSYQKFFNEGKLNSITYGIGGGTSFFDTNSRFTTITPAVGFNWRPVDFVSNRRQFLLFRLRNVFRNFDESIVDLNDTEPDFTVFNVRFGDVDNNILNFKRWVVDGQVAGDFTKVSFEWEQRTLFNNNRQLNLRVFAGKFLTNSSNSDFFSFALDRPTDYLFDLPYLDRSINASGLASQQFILAEGGFKSIFEDRFANDWILTGNLSFNIWQWIELYGDIGLIGDRGESSRFFYDSGVRLNLVTDFFELYFPVYSNNGYEIAQPNYGERIRFVVTVSPQTLIGLFTRKWF